MSDPKEPGVGSGRGGAGGATATNSLFERYKDALRRGHVAALRGRDDAAIDAYGEAATLAPDRVLPHVSIAAILARMGRLDDAATAYDRALQIAPRDEAALRGLAEVHVAAGRPAAAADALDHLADVLDGTGRLPEATDTARRALELAESRSRRGQVAAYVERLRADPAPDEDAQAALDRAGAILEPKSDGDADAPDPLRVGIALSAVAEAALHSDDPVAARDALLDAARAHRGVGRLGAAVDACYLAVGLLPSDPELHLVLVDLYLDRGWRQQAVDKLLLLRRLAELDDDAAVRDRVCAVARERLPEEPRVAALCA
jgi:tetratricopeptide (TPR) repeat protein